MENQFENSEQFQEHYGYFPYIVHRMHPAIYMQIPILFSLDHQPGELPGIIVNVKPEQADAAELMKSQSLREQLKQIAQKVRFNMQEQYKAKVEICLVYGPTDCIYMNGEKPFDSKQPPNGGTICNVKRQPMVLPADLHWRKVDHAPRVWSKEGI